MIRVQSEDFDLSLEVRKLTEENPAIGAVTAFIGLVRDIAGGTEISSMTLEHYPGMTEKMLREIETEAHQRWNLDASLIIHRYGQLAPGDQIVLVVTCSKHRKAAFESCEFLMDFLKTKAPFWKLEETPEGGKWVDARDGDTKATERWLKS
ncbi:molybdenum cofactor biosynthesis protein MoaE [Kiloniella laminariae]|uniref:Molybdopterin synthase catalytic subunit n=1 Tax=Kiloniella laminariae TaxID=454162 RepID=A0ABT4LL84_9PROT|nr:molybdenum cofactor biosynthesis protein MoaE [Kiloniella laminariae]MCZ4281875.1 molybdenum cofactor biosynthesis protein MoaE [Kiloniella laminariae]